MNNQEVDNLKSLLEEAQGLIQQYETSHQQIMQTVEEKRRILNNTLSTAGDSVQKEDDHFDDAKMEFVASKEVSVNEDILDDERSRMQKQSSFLLGANEDLDANLDDNSGEDNNKAPDSETQATANTSVAENNALITQIRANMMPDATSSNQQSIVDSVLQEDYFQRVHDAYLFPKETRQYNDSLTEQLTNYGDDRMSEIQSIISTHSVALQKPQLSKHTGDLFSKLQKTDTEVLSIDIPKINNQPDFLREQILDRKLGQYLHTINQCLKYVQTGIHELEQRDLEQLLVQAEIQNKDEPLITSDEVEQLCDMLDDELHAVKEHPDIASFLDKYQEIEEQQAEVIKLEEEHFYQQMKIEEEIRREGDATNRLREVIMQAKELIADQPKKRGSSARPILGSSQVDGQKVKIKRVPDMLDNIQK